MNSDLKQQALAYLNKNFVLNISMIDPILQKKAEILLAEEQGVLIRVAQAGFWMVSADSVEVGMHLLETAMEHTKEEQYPHMIIAHQEFLKQPISETYGMRQLIACRQVAYTKSEDIPLHLEPNQEIKTLGQEHYEIVVEHYHTVDEEGYLRYLLGEGVMHGLYVDGEMVGFIGVHGEGSIGLLEVFPEHRCKGYGTILQKFMINFVRSKGRVPFGQVIENNTKSMGLQKKIGMEEAPTMTYWMCKA